MDEEPLDTGGDALDALRAWLLTEDAFARGAVADEVVQYLQDHVGRLLGPRAVPVTHDFLRQDLARGGELAVLARDRSQLTRLLELIEGTRRPGFENHWHASRSTEDHGSRPAALLVMAEHGVGDPVWDRPAGRGEPVRLTGLGVSESLVRRLRQWNQTFEHLVRTDSEWASPEAEDAWVQQGLRLAHELQRELPDIDVRYFHADDDRPLRSL